MTTWPALAINIITFNRKDILRETIQGLQTHLDYAGPIHWVIADDSSDDGTRIMCQSLIPDVTITQSPRLGLGGNTNAGLRTCLTKADYVLQLQDDMRLLSHLDLHPHVQKLADDATSGFVRLWGVGGHKYTATLDGNHWRIAWDCDELYIPSDRPHLKHRRFHEAVGFYPEGLKTDKTEDAWCYQCKEVGKRDKNAPAVLVPQIETERNWEHLGWHTRWRDKGL